MRSKIATGAVGLGVFLIVAAVLVRAYAYPTLARVPAGYESVTMLESTGAEVFNSDPEVLAPETTDLSISSRTVADSAAQASGDTVVWVNATTVTRADGTVFQQSRERVPFDAVTGRAVTCEPCDSWTEESEGARVPTDREGQVYKFPFATEKKDYAVWDDSVGEPVTATYEGTEEIQGLTVYKFVQRIDPTVIETREVPGSIFGSPDPSVDADMSYAMTRTFYVEPQTGSPINRVEERVQELQYDGTAVPAFTGTVRYTQDQVDDLVAQTKSKAAVLSGMRLLFPLVMGLLGGALVAGGVLLGRGATRRNQPERQDRSLVHA